MARSVTRRSWPGDRRPHPGHDQRTGATAVRSRIEGRARPVRGRHHRRPAGARRQHRRCSSTTRSSRSASSPDRSRVRKPHAVQESRSRCCRSCRRERASSQPRDDVRPLTRRASWAIGTRSSGRTPVSNSALSPYVDRRRRQPTRMVQAQARSSSGPSTSRAASPSEEASSRSPRTNSTGPSMPLRAAEAHDLLAAVFVAGVFLARALPQHPDHRSLIAIGAAVLPGGVRQLQDRAAGKKFMSQLPDTLSCSPAR